MKRSRVVMVGILVGGLLLAALNAAAIYHLIGPGPIAPPPSSGVTPPEGSAPPPIHFADVTAAAGIRFRHRQLDFLRYLPEIMGSGTAWGDYNGDGWPDLFLVNGSSRGDNVILATMSPSRLYCNKGNGAFADATVAAGAGSRGLGMSAVWGDYDNDGRPDLYVTNFLSANRLYHNNGDGTFTDVTRAAGIGGHGASMGAAWGDVDRDGFLDLYVPSYVEYSATSKTARLFLRKGRSDSGRYDDPSPYPPKRGLLYHNNGDGTFTDVTAAAGVHNIGGRGLQAVLADLDNDGWPDLFIGNDLSLNHLYRNVGRGRFEDVSVHAYMADVRSSMGVAAGDYDGDGDLDLFCSHWMSEGSALFRNNLIAGGIRRPFMAFNDMNQVAGLLRFSLHVVGWGDAFLDADNDGRLDLFVVNGHTNVAPALGNPLHRLFQPAEAPYLFWDRGDGAFVELGAGVGPFFQKRHIGRGTAQADYDRNGLPDLAVTTNNGPAYLLRNTTALPNHWLRLTLRGARSNRDAVGSRILVESGGRTQIREVMAGGSYLSCHDLTQVIGLGAAAAADGITVRWPSGAVTTVGSVEADQSVVLAEPAGAGVVSGPPAPPP